MMGRTARFLVVAGALIAALSAAAAAPRLTQIPARFHGKDVFLQVSLNGRAPIWLRFDAGAGDSVLIPASIPADQSARMTVRLGDTTLNGIFFDVSPTTQRAPDGIAVAGRIGRDSFGSRMLIIRYREHQVWLSPPIDTGPDPAPAPLRTASR